MVEYEKFVKMMVNGEEIWKKMRNFGRIEGKIEWLKGLGVKIGIM